MRRGKTALLLLTCSVCTAVLMALWPVQPALQVETAVVGSGELVQSVLLSGTVQYAQQQACLSLKSGIVQQVHVTAGQQVKSGDLLFSLDTSAEEQALAALYEQRYVQQAVLSGLDDAAAVLAMQSRQNATASEMQLLAAIEASQIRASADGVVQAVYVQPGERVAETALMGVVRGTKLEVMASSLGGALDGIYPGAAAVATADKRESVPLLLKQVGRQLTDAAGAQTLFFQLMRETEWEAGDRVEVELITDVHPVCALIPLSAVNMENEVWFVEDGRAFREQLDVERYNRTHAAAPLEWAGRTVILYPEQHELTEGMPVKGAGTP